jgi:dipeptidyl-peptidase-4
MLIDVDFPELAEQTDRFRRGAPHAITVGNDGSRVVFLRSAGPRDPDSALWVLNVATATERLAAPGPIAAYATDPAARVATYAQDGRLHRVDLISGDATTIDTGTPVTDPRPDPAGNRIGYVTRTADGVVELRTVDRDGRDELLAGEPGGHVTWGVPEAVAAHEFHRDRGWWWGPDGTTVLAARGDTSRMPDPTGHPHPGGVNVRVSLHLLDLDGGWVDVHWDRETYPYLVDVRWAPGGGPLITVLRRLQQHGLVLAVDPRTGETQVHAELADARWVEPVPGTPRHLPDGRVLVGGELAHDGFDARCLFADGSLLTPPSLYVRRVIGVLPRTGAPAAGPDLILEGNDGDPGEQHVFRVRTALGGGGADARRLTDEPGWHSAEVGGDVIVVGTRGLDTAGTRWTVWRGDVRVADLATTAEPLPTAVRPALERVTDRRLPAAVLYPQTHLVGRKLPVIVDLGCGSPRQHVTQQGAAWQERQWWADAGFAVVCTDTRGTPGMAPSFEKVVHRRLADVTLTDQVDALVALTGKHPDLDLDQVAVRGTGLGGWLAALAVLRRPERFACAVARDPITDWTLLRSAFAERYLGLPDDSASGGDVYAHHNLIEVAAEPTSGPEDARPLLLVAAPDALGAALATFGRPYETLAAPDLHAELAFIRSQLT